MRRCAKADHGFPGTKVAIEMRHLVVRQVPEAGEENQEVGAVESRQPGMFLT